MSHSKKQVRIESFTGGVTRMDLADAMTTFGADELHEYLQGHNEQALYFLEIDGVDVFEGMYDHLYPNT